MNEHLREALVEIDGVVESDSAFGHGLAFWVNGKEIAHFEGEDAIDIRLTRQGIRQRRERLRSDPRVILRSGTSDWLEVTIASSDAEDLAIELVEAAATAHRAAPGTLAAPPPSGADLARRRRFH
jgi:hypothetical protein